MKPDIHVHIEELVLYGFAPGDRYRIGEAVERELARLLAEHGAPSSLMQGGEVTRLDGGSFDIAPGSKADSISAQIAHSVYGGLKL